MASTRQREQWWAEQRLITETAELLRCRARQQQAEADQEARRDTGDVTLSAFPLDRYKVVRLLDELALAAGRGDLPRDVRRAVMAVCDGLRAEAERTPH
ncbi:hypothetical protein REH65_05220 [Saccharopolyspora sp. ID03-671]|uniref:hypothetical protein n=1 Tax=Saccharopolyspora sp. ID03-671 TaxID=3073066 RepID=UPI003243F247